MPLPAQHSHWITPPTTPPGKPVEVLVAGGGVAGLEALLALRHLAGAWVHLTLLADEPEFVYRPMAVGEPFSRGHALRHPIADLAARLDATLVEGSLARVDDDARTAITTAGEELAYDALLVAVGARGKPALAHVHTWTPETDAEVLGGLLRDLEEGYSKRVAFVVPDRVAWSLPAYELALMTAWEVRSMGFDDVEITLYTPELTPLAVFGSAASRALSDDLREVGIVVRTETLIRESGGRLVADPGGDVLDGVRVVALPRAVGPAVEGLALNDEGFIRTASDGRVEGSAAVWAAGDAIDYPVKQGGLAAQQADAAAESIAAFAGADVDPQPFHPVLRGVLLTGRGQAWMRGPDAVDGDGVTARKALFWPPTKVAGAYLSPFLATLDAAGGDGADAAPSGAPVDLDLAPSTAPHASAVAGS